MECLLKFCTLRTDAGFDILAVTCAPTSVTSGPLLFLLPLRIAWFPHSPLSVLSVYFRGHLPEVRQLCPSLLSPHPALVFATELTPPNLLVCPLSLPSLQRELTAPGPGRRRTDTQCTSADCGSNRMNRRCLTFLLPQEVPFHSGGSPLPKSLILLSPSEPPQCIQS